MYERFTDRSRKVMQLANQEAQRFNHEYIGTEHVLLGLIKEGSGVAATVLNNLGIDLRKIRLEVEKIVQSGPDMVNMGKLPQTPRTKKVIEYAMDEARKLNHNYVGTEHILLGLLREEEGVGCQVLKNFGLDTQKIQEEVKTLLGHTTNRIDTFKRDQEFMEKFAKTLARSSTDQEIANKIIDLTAMYSKGMLVSNEFIYKVKEVVDQLPSDTVTAATVTTGHPNWTWKPNK